MNPASNDVELLVKHSRSLLRSERWRWYITHANGHQLYRSSEGYTDQGRCYAAGLDGVGRGYRLARVRIVGPDFELVHDFPDDDEPDDGSVVIIETQT